MQLLSLSAIFNLSSLCVHCSSHMMGISGQFLTKQYFTNVMLDLKHESVSPVQSLPQAQLASLNCPSDQPLPHDCWEVQQQGHNTSGIYRIKPYLSSVPFFVYCQLEARGGGWTVSCILTC
jgi:hypothetical protein